MVKVADCVLFKKQIHFMETKSRPTGVVHDHHHLILESKFKMRNWPRGSCFSLSLLFSWSGWVAFGRIGIIHSSNLIGDFIPRLDKEGQQPPLPMRVPLEYFCQETLNLIYLFCSLICRPLLETDKWDHLRILAESSSGFWVSLVNRRGG